MTFKRRTRAAGDGTDWLAALKAIQGPRRALPGLIDADLAPPGPEHDTLMNAVAHFRAGGFVIIEDDPDREGEGDLCLAAEYATADRIRDMIMWAHGTPCVALTYQRCADLSLSSLWPFGFSPGETEEDDKPPMMTPVDACVGTGVSAVDRARTIRFLAGGPDAPRCGMSIPGHVVPLCAHPDGVLKRRGHTEASVDLCKIAGLTPAAAICEIMVSTGDMADHDDLLAFAWAHSIPLITVDQIARYRTEYP